MSNFNYDDILKLNDDWKKKKYVVGRKESETESTTNSNSSKMVGEPIQIVSNLAYLSKVKKENNICENKKENLLSK